MVVRVGVEPRTSGGLDGGCRKISLGSGTGCGTEPSWDPNKTPPTFAGRPPQLYPKTWVQPRPRHPWEYRTTSRPDWRGIHGRHTWGSRSLVHNTIGLRTPTGRGWSEPLVLKGSGEPGSSATQTNRVTQEYGDRRATVFSGPFVPHKIEGTEVQTHPRSSTTLRNPTSKESSNWDLLPRTTDRPKEPHKTRSKRILTTLFTSVWPRDFYCLYGRESRRRPSGFSSTTVPADAKDLRDPPRGDGGAADHRRPEPNADGPRSETEGHVVGKGNEE